MTDEFAPISHEEAAETGEVTPEGVDEQYLYPAEPAAEDAPLLPAPPSFLERLRILVFGSAAQTEERLRELTHAIAMRPESPSNYVLRGELYLSVGLPDLASSDFEMAHDLALAQLESKDWGVVAQGMLDRAQFGMKQAQKMQGKRSE